MRQYYIEYTDCIEYMYNFLSTTYKNPNTHIIRIPTMSPVNYGKDK